ncbi:tetraacyldisaccharide 4'-kinase [Tistrella bauzanensis]|uniref:Tetraacyldisaccharide 4'-kinase n=1 Tax=Tistrella arctica TaxID=3133430 RepID=A0ABU9YJC6_9PROT
MKAPEFWGRDPTTLDRLLIAALAPLTLIFRLAGSIRRLVVRPANAGVPVLCVGNLTAGGAGKTPTALAIADRLRARGRRPHVVLRGYGGSVRGPTLVDPIAHRADQVGDEALLIARRLPTWVARDRVAGARAAAAAGADIVILDDGFQNPSIDKDLSLIVVDGGYGFGNGRVMPAGPLREPLAQGLARADGVVVVGEDSVDVAARLPFDRPVLRAVTVPGPETRRLRNRKVVAFAGIGRPEKFFDTLRAIGCRIAGSWSFPDHHPYAPDEIARLVEVAHRMDAVLVTTEKDLVRLPPEARDLVDHLTISLEWLDADPLDRLLDRIDPRSPRPDPVPGRPSVLDGHAGREDGNGRRR